MSKFKFGLVKMDALALISGGFFLKQIICFDVRVGNLIKKLMRSITILTAMFLTLVSYGSNESEIISSTKKIGKLEVMTEDLGKMDWYEAKKACKNLRNGWRLPTKDELNLLYENKGEIGGFTNNFYWSSEEKGNDGFAYLQDYRNGEQFSNQMAFEAYVRAVRDEQYYIAPYKMFWDGGYGGQVRLIKNYLDMSPKKSAFGYKGRVEIKWYYRNGNLEQIYTEIEDEKNGLYQKYYENGQLKESVNYVNGDKEGIWKSYHENGQIEDSVNYVNGDKEGIELSFYKSGMLYSRSNFVNGKIDGLYERWFSNGEIACEFNYSEGRRTGVWKSYYENGQLEFVETYELNKQIKFEEYFKKGKLKQIGYSSVYNKEGIWKSYYENGQLKDSTDYFEGKKIGYSESFYENGQLKEAGEFYSDNGEKYKEWKYYNENGDLTETKFHQNALYYKWLLKKQEEEMQENSSINKNSNTNDSPTSCVICNRKIYPNSGTGNYYSLYYWASPKIGGLGCTQRSTKERPTSKMKGMGPYCSSSCCNSSSAKSGRAAPYNK